MPSQERRRPGSRSSPSTRVSTSSRSSAPSPTSAKRRRSPERLQVKGVTDLATTTNQIRTKLTVDKGVDTILTLNPDVAGAALDAVKGANSKAKIATFDLSSNVIKAIQGGKVLFAIDQQQYLQGYLPVVFLYLYNTNLNTVGGGLPVLTGPGFVDKSNAAKVAALAKKGTR